MNPLTLAPLVKSAWDAKNAFGKHDDVPQSPQMGMQVQPMMQPQAMYPVAQASMFPQPQALSPVMQAPQPQQDKPEGFEEHRSFFDAAKHSLGMGLAGAAAGAFSKFKDARDHHKSLLSAGFDAMKGGVAGGIAGTATSMAHQAIEEDGGGMKAALAQSVAAGATSTLKEGGPGLITSMLAGGASGFGADAVHDKLAHDGHTTLADSLSGAVQGGDLGFSYGGMNAKSIGIGGLGGAGLSALGSMLSDKSDSGNMGKDASNAWQNLLPQENSGNMEQESKDTGLSFG